MSTELSLFTQLKDLYSRNNWSSQLFRKHEESAKLALALSLHSYRALSCLACMTGEDAPTLKRARHKVFSSYHVVSISFQDAQNYPVPGSNTHVNSSDLLLLSPGTRGLANDTQELTPNRWEFCVTISCFLRNHFTAFLGSCVTSIHPLKEFSEQPQSVTNLKVSKQQETLVRSYGTYSSGCLGL